MFDDRPNTNDIETSDRAVGQSLMRGYRRKCPHCGSGPLLRGYLKLRQQCAVCGTDLSPARADDGPAYLTILIVGHLMAPFMHVFFTTFRPDPMVLATVFCTACVGLSLYLLPRIKGMIVGFQWAKRMHGF
ncbi:hypothetical protein PARPLA_02633 [Rhodobacteraceae bacterium THAF1]|uniref:DUF983 domain-containing protein n=1 Tax=Palleronia sp. THAF1 TaxID=2587842 RepID=UPI000F41ECB0|nr:DUF983 domain-containing protein [Palleronia sp. THAF1]QFU08111.1 hypothetical protein FIU81_05440 [Palleronia sp. THAF1]VDC27978.1 hypothetical protein PARPLA_02633 [Rhodobacteraceae bacterium THAF1]